MNTVQVEANNEKKCTILLLALEKVLYQTPEKEVLEINGIFLHQHCVCVCVCMFFVSVCLSACRHFLNYLPGLFWNDVYALSYQGGVFFVYSVF